MPVTQATKPVDVERPLFGRRDPDARGYFGAYGGRFVPETLVAPVEGLGQGYFHRREDPAVRSRSLAPASTASRPRRRARSSASSAMSTWAPRTCSARRST